MEGLVPGGAAYGFVSAEPIGEHFKRIRIKEKWKNKIFPKKLLVTKA